MRTIEVEQAIFASSDRGTVKGYQLVAKSPGIDRTVSQALCRWAPTQIPHDESSNWTINYFPIDDDRVAVTRTVLGGPEYSGRGGHQVVTLILVLREAQFQAYSCNPILVAKTAMAIGLLRLPLEMDREQLPTAILPSQPLVLPGNQTSEENSLELELLEAITDLLRQARRVAFVGSSDPLSLIEQLIPRLPLEERRNLSFTTGLCPTVRRPFQVHFLPHADLARQRTLEAQQITRIEIPHNAFVPHLPPND